MKLAQKKGALAVLALEHLQLHFTQRFVLP
jgi:hypothetical protein